MQASNTSADMKPIPIEKTPESATMELNKLPSINNNAPEKSEICDANMIMAGQTPWGSEENYPRIMYDTIDSAKLQSLIQNTGIRVDQAPDIASLPKTPQQDPSVAQLPPTPLNMCPGIDMASVNTKSNQGTFNVKHNGNMSGQEIMSAATSHITSPNIVQQYPNQVDTQQNTNFVDTAINKAQQNPNLVDTSNVESQNMKIISTVGMVGGPPNPPYSGT